MLAGVKIEKISASRNIETSGSFYFNTSVFWINFTANSFVNICTCRPGDTLQQNTNCSMLSFPLKIIKNLFFPNSDLACFCFTHWTSHCAFSEECLVSNILIKVIAHDGVPKWPDISPRHLQKLNSAEISSPEEAQIYLQVMFSIFLGTFPLHLFPVHDGTE